MVAVNAVGVVESVAWKVKEALVAEAVGVPLISPVAGFSVNPAGSVPEVSAKVYGALPPVAVSVCEYGVLTEPFASEVVVIARPGGAEIVNVKGAVAVCGGAVESATWNVTGAFTTAAVGVPEI